MDPTRGAFKGRIRLRPAAPAADEDDDSDDDADENIDTLVDEVEQFLRDQDTN